MMRSYRHLDTAFNARWEHMLNGCWIPFNAAEILRFL